MQLVCIQKINHHPQQHHGSAHLPEASLQASSLALCNCMLNESHNSEYVVIKMGFFIQEMNHVLKKLSIKRSAKGVKAFQLSQVESQPFTA